MQIPELLFCISLNFYFNKVKLEGYVELVLSTPYLYTKSIHATYLFPTKSIPAQVFL